MATKTGRKNHTHRYYKLSDGLWHCSLDDCSHFMPGNVPESTIIGKKSICWSCGDEFKLTEELMKNERPICLVCSNPQVTELAAYLKEKGI